MLAELVMTSQVTIFFVLFPIAPALCVASIQFHHYQVDLNINSSSLAEGRGSARVIKESKELVTLLFPFIKLGQVPSGLL
jgi:hypothetical protein